MYSPPARPSSSRAAPAKNRTWSIATSSSSLLVSDRSFPVFCDSASTRSSACSAIRSATFKRACWRFDGVLRPQLCLAPAAASYARATSSASEIGAVPKTVPRTGSIRSVRRPAVASHGFPSMTFCTVRSALAMVSPSGSSGQTEERQYETSFQSARGEAHFLGGHPVLRASDRRGVRAAGELEPFGAGGPSAHRCDRARPAAGHRGSCPARPTSRTSSGSRR